MGQKGVWEFSKNGVRRGYNVRAKEELSESCESVYKTVWNGGFVLYTEAEKPSKNRSSLSGIAINHYIRPPKVGMCIRFEKTRIQDRERDSQCFTGHCCACIHFKTHPYTRLFRSFAGFFTDYRPIWALFRWIRSTCIRYILATKNFFVRKM